MKQQIAIASETEASGGEVPDNLGSPNASFDLEGKVVIDLKDPNRPRFTLQELRQVCLSLLHNKSVTQHDSTIVYNVY